MIDPTSDQALKSKSGLTAIVYALQASAIFFGFTGIVAVIINYLKRRDVAGTYLESHFRWQIRTFWFSYLWAILAAMFLLTGTFFILMVVPILLWYMYRIIKGWLRLRDKKPMYAAP